MEKVSLKLVILYIFMAYMAFLMFESYFPMPGNSASKEPVQSRDTNPAEDGKDEKHPADPNESDKGGSSAGNKDGKEKGSSKSESEDPLGKFPHNVPPALRAQKDHLISIPMHLFEGTAD